MLHASFHGQTWLPGGPQGPEASLLVFPVIALMFFSFDRLYREARFPRLEGSEQAPRHSSPGVKGANSRRA
jgi:hypothetical protein